MNGAFGLVALLLAGLIMAYVWADHTQTVSKVNKTIQPQLKQLAGQSPDGTPAVKSAKYAPVEANGVLKGVKITSIDLAGGLHTYWGLQANDVVTRIGPFTVGDSTIPDLETARDWIVEGMQRKMDMSVDRGGAIITLPADRGVPSPAAGAGLLNTPGNASGPTSGGN
jgi:hypothetical protein